MIRSNSFTAVQAVTQNGYSLFGKARLLALGKDRDTAG